MSYGMGIPGWEELLTRLESEEGLVRRLVNSGYSLPRIATYLCVALGRTRPEFNAMVRERLYTAGQLSEYFDRKFSELENGANKYIHFVENQNPNLAATARLLVVPSYSGALTRNPKYAPNPKVAAVVTTNYDDLLRSYVWEKFVVQDDPAHAESRRILRTVDRPSATPRHGMINLYHVHGFLQLKKYETNGDRDAGLGSIVLTESDYFDEFSTRSTYFPSVLHQTMSHHVCVFVGMSMTDQNINRILHQVRYDFDTSVQRESSGSSRRSVGHHIALLCDNQQDKDVVAALLEELRVMPIWYHDHSEIPEIIKEIYLRTYYEANAEKAMEAWDLSGA